MSERERERAREREWSLPECKTDYKREENMADALDNCDDPVIHIGNSNEAPMVDSDNVGDNRFTINIPSNFTSPSFHYGASSLGSNLKKYVRNFLWLYYKAEDEALQV